MQTTAAATFATDLLNTVKLTDADKQKLRAIGLMHRICSMLHWDEETYTQFQYDEGLCYLKELAGGHSGVQRGLEANKGFWSWWRVQWSIRDEVYCEDRQGMQQLSVTQRTQIYKGLHAGHLLYPDLKVPKFILISLL